MDSDSLHQSSSGAGPHTDGIESSLELQTQPSSQSQPKRPRQKSQQPLKKQKPNDNRKNAQATRTLKACELCRKQKTRCFRVNEETKSCLRCTFLNKECSFLHEISAVGETMGDISTTKANVAPPATDKKLDMIFQGVNEILSMLKNGPVGDQGVNSIVNSNDAKLLLEAANSMKQHSDSPFHESAEEHTERLTTNPIDLENQTDFQSPSNSLEVSPFQIITNQIKSDLVPKNIENLLNLSTVQKMTTGEPNSGGNVMSTQVPNILTLNILPLSEVINLMTDFRRNYGRWISFPSNLPTEILVERLTSKSPLLLTTCCVLSLRYSFNNINPGDINNSMRKRLVFNSLVKQLIKELNLNLMKVNCFKNSNGDIEFLQSMVILSIYSSSLTSIVLSNNQALLRLNNNNVGSLNFKEFNINLNDINFDPWYLSGVGLNLFISKTTLGNLLPKDNNIIDSPYITSPFTILYDEELDSNEYQTLTVMRIYNHLVLVHLINCVFSGRMCVVDEIRLNYCNITLGLPSSTNFDGRMVSEISILLITYNFVQINLNVNNLSLPELDSNLKSTLREIKVWYDQWDYLFQQPALQFVEVCCNFCKLLICYSYNYQKYLILNNFQDINKTDTFNQDNIKFILSISTVEDKLKLFEYSNNILNFVNLINNDSYFAYLSDQLQFCFFFAAVFLLKYLYILNQENNLGLLHMTDVNDLNCITNIKLLISKFNNINNNESNDNDIISKFKNSLKFQLKKLFPQY